MKKRKVLSAVALGLCLALGLSGCSGKKPGMDPGESYLAELETRDVADLMKQIREAEEAARKQSEEASWGEEPQSEGSEKESGKDSENDPENGTDNGPENDPEKETDRNSGKDPETDHSAETSSPQDSSEELMALLRAQVESGKAEELSPEELGRLKARFSTVAVVGDSMAQALLEYGLLDESQVFYERGGITRNLGPVTDRALQMYPETVIFFTGLNDADHETYDSYPEAYAQRVAQVHAALPEAKILICSMTPPSNSLGAVREDLARAPVFDQVLEGWCAGSPYADYVDLKWMVRQDWYMDDGIHFKRSFYLIWLQYLDDILC